MFHNIIVQGFYNFFLPAKIERFLSALIGFPFFYFSLKKEISTAKFSLKKEISTTKIKLKEIALKTPPP